MLLIGLTAVLALTGWVLPVAAGELIVNGGFDTGDFGPVWVHGAHKSGASDPTAADHIVVADLPYQGIYSALLGFKYTKQQAGAAGFMYQDVTIPANASFATLFFKIRQQGYDGVEDSVSVQIRDISDVVLQTVLSRWFPVRSARIKDSGWLNDDGVAPTGFDMMGYAGQTVRLYFEQINNSNPQAETWTFVDNVSIVYQMWVDLVVEGDGNDVFGAPASGAGGLGVLRAVAGDTLIYDLRLENEGPVDDSFLLTLSSPLGNAWIEAAGVPQSFPYTTPNVPAGVMSDYRVYVVVPPGTAAGSYDMVLDASSTSAGGRFDSATLRASVVAVDVGADLTVDGNGLGNVGTGGVGGFALRSAPWDSTVTYALELHNTGSDASAFQIGMSPDLGTTATVWVAGVPYTSPFVTPVVPAGGSLVMTLDVQVASPNPGRDYKTLVEATPVADPLRKDSIRALLRLRVPALDMIIVANGDGIYGPVGSGLGGSATAIAIKGSTVSYILILENESSLADSFQLTYTPPQPSWNAFVIVGGVRVPFPFATPTVAPFSRVEYVVEVDVSAPGNPVFKTFLSIFDAVSLTDSRVEESVSGAVSISDGVPGVDLIIDGNGLDFFGPLQTGLGGSSVIAAVPGDTIIFTVDVLSMGGTDAHDISWNVPAGWTVTFDNLVSPIAAYPQGTYELRAIVPISSTGGTFDIIVDATKSGEPYYNDSVLGRIVVARPLSVDAIIDGNGDEVFGTLGSGLGGFSTVTGSPPISANFFVEIQNQSDVADQYTVTWNTVPGWTATLNGSSSPLATALIGANGFQLLSLQVSVPANAVGGSYSYVVDIVSTTDGAVVESIEAEIVVVGPPMPDFVIDGNGAGITGTLWSGDGGASLVVAAPGAFHASMLELRNIGSFADSFYVDWRAPGGWPAGAVLINDGVTDHAAPFWSTAIAAGSFVSYAVKVQVPPSAGAGLFTTLINAYSSLPPNSTESVRLTVQTFGVVTGVVFEDRDHDGIFGAGDAGLANVVVREDISAQEDLTDGAGRYTFTVPAATPVTVIERNPSGFISLSPDTVASVGLLAGDTLHIDFADVLPLRLTPGITANGIGGSFIDFPHRLDAATTGQVALIAATDPGIVTMFMLDQNGNGVFDGTDRTLQASDIDMDPPSGTATVYFLLRVFVPASMPLGTTFHVTIDATQAVGATAETTAAQAVDAVVVVGNALGRVTLQKEVDMSAATPGQVLTYTITFFNAGVDSLQNVIVVDPVSQFVDPVSDAFGPGQDVEWQRQGVPPMYLTLASDADECEFSVSERILRLLFSKNTPYFLQPGETGTLSYRVMVR
jgi:uncharacterized repeat protein (TIGR01451 family)